MKEVEIRAYDKISNGGVVYEADAFVTDKGNTLNLIYNSPVSSGYIRHIELYYISYNFATQERDNIKIGDYFVRHNEPTDGTLVFDIGKIASTVIATSSDNTNIIVDIERYTAEANVTTDYGSRRMSFPYSIVDVKTASASASTDGVYVLKIQDYRKWSSEETYTERDTVYYEDDSEDPIISLYKATTQSEGLDPSEGVGWETINDVDLISIPNTFDSKSNIVIWDYVLVTRSVKQDYLLPALKQISFKGYDNNPALNAALEIVKIRNRSLSLIEEQKPIEAIRVLWTVPLVFMDDKPVDTTENYSNNNNNNYTL